MLLFYSFKFVLHFLMEWIGLHVRVNTDDVLDYVLQLYNQSMFQVILKTSVHSA